MFHILIFMPDRLEHIIRMILVPCEAFFFFILKTLSFWQSGRIKESWPSVGNERQVSILDFNS